MVFSILALLTVCISICIKDRKKSLYVQSLNCVLYHLLSVSKKDYFMYTLLIVST